MSHSANFNNMSAQSPGGGKYANVSVKNKINFNEIELFSNGF